MEKPKFIDLLPLCIFVLAALLLFSPNGYIAIWQKKILTKHVPPQENVSAWNINEAGIFYNDLEVPHRSVPADNPKQVAHELVESIKARFGGTIQSNNNLILISTEKQSFLIIIQKDKLLVIADKALPFNELF